MRIFEELFIESPAKKPLRKKRNYLQDERNRIQSKIMRVRSIGIQERMQNDKNISKRSKMNIFQVGTGG